MPDLTPNDEDVQTQKRIERIIQNAQAVEEKAKHNHIIINYKSADEIGNGGLVATVERKRQKGQWPEQIGEVVLNGPGKLQAVIRTGGVNVRNGREVDDLHEAILEIIDSIQEQGKEGSRA